MKILSKLFKEPSNVILYNTFSSTNEILSPIKKKHVSIYSCGPTVYDRVHIGNLRAYVLADTLNRVLKDAGYSVKHVINITDVGHLTDDADGGVDKIEKIAKIKKVKAEELTKNITNYFFEDLKFT